MRHLTLGVAALILSASLAHAQTSAASPTAAPGTGMASTSRGAPPTPSPLPGNTGGSADKRPASGDANQAVVTTGANADQPAKGANSFSKRQAMKRIAAKGYAHVTGLAKDGDGVWRGTATKDGQPIQVWLDYKGNVGQQS